MIDWIIASAVAATLSWGAPTSNCDGSAITSADPVTSFELHYGTKSRATAGLPVDQANATCEQMVDKADLTSAGFAYDHTAIVTPPSMTYTIDYLPPGTYWFTINACTADGCGPFSNEVSKVIEDGPIAPFFIESAQCAPTTDCGEFQGKLLLGMTGKPVTIQWNAPGPAHVELIEYGSTTPVATGDFTSNTWTFTPTRAGLYWTRVRTCDTCEWVSSIDQGFMYHFKLAPPTPGGID